MLNRAVVRRLLFLSALPLFLLLIVSCSDENNSPTVPLDETPPGRISDLSVVLSARADSAVLSWTAPGGDGSKGKAATYDVRYASSPLTEQTFAGGTPVSDLPSPADTGQTESLKVPNLPTGEWYFAVIAVDDAGNRSEISNAVAAGIVNAEAPAMVDDLSIVAASRDQLTVSWTAPGADGDLGTASHYDLRFSTEVISAKNWASATPVVTQLVPSVAGTIETAVVNGLELGVTYYLALRSADASGNESPLSNVASAPTVAFTQVTTSPIEDGIAAAPCWSPDGTRIAFHANWEGPNDIWVLELEGGRTLLQITDSEMLDMEPSWSPDGSKIAFASNRNGSFEIWSVEPKVGATPERLGGALGLFAAEPAWSPDGARVAFQAPRQLQMFSNYNIYSIPADGGTAEILLEGGGQPVGDPAWSPDGRSLVLLSGRSVTWDLWLFTVESREWSRLTTSLISTFNENPAFSPSGRSIAFESNWTGNSEIYLTTTNGSDRRVKITDGEGEKREAAWSPDGTMLAYRSNRTGSYEIYIQPVDEDQ